ncbi:DUF4249 domain-containing protein [Bizionia saleffrena]|uniref:DUF4249 domain-containing protein n=1 Tax=Bizionia saleffrena TaxID=291189 RepID=A0A8H2QII9_9FLAO|nr:DUF4249 domain-containing protein [Bizionia saleffrena]TYB71476.1 DUF4249 domain-containing protein [Bizionia saleffrena]
MKKLSLLFLLLISTFSCEDVIDIQVPKAEPKLVIEASINWFNGTAGNVQEVKLTQSAPYFNTTIPPANNAIVTITDTANNTFFFTEENNSGIYKNSTFIPVIDSEYTLNITYKNEDYTATETLTSVTPIDYIEQKNDGGFSGEDIEIKAYYTDPENQENYYFYEFITDIAIIPTLEVYEDEFFNGNQIFAFFSEEDLKAGDQLKIRNYGISEQFFVYMTVLLQQSNQSGGGPFQTQPATVRGNCINVTKPDNFPLGYFRLSQANELIYTVE